MELLRAIALKLRTLLWTQLAKRPPSENAYLALIPLVGLITGVAALGIAHFITFLQSGFWGSGTRLLEAVQETPWYLRIFVPACVGGFLGVLAWRLRTD